MIIIAIVRVSSLRALSRNIDVQWLVFWQQLEACVAVIVVSITAFRSLLGIKASKQRQKKARFQYWYQERVHNQNPAYEELGPDYSSSAPGTILTEIRTSTPGYQHSTSIALTGQHELAE